MAYSKQMQQQIIDMERILVDKTIEGDLAAVQALINSGVSVNAEGYTMSLYYKSKNYWSPLHHACFKGHTNIVELLIKNKAEYDTVDMFAVTAMHLAAENGHVDCLRILLDAGASCNIGTASKRPQWVTVTVYPYLPDTRPLHLAAKNNHVPCILQLMLFGADYNAVDGEGRTALYISAEGGHEDAVLTQLRSAYGKTILSLPAPLTGDTALHHCVQHTLLAALAELLIHGSDVNYINRMGMSPLHLAFTNTLVHSAKMVNMIVKNGYNTNVNLPDGNGLYPLEYVSFRGNSNKRERRPNYAAYLIAHGANFERIKSARGQTLLQQELSHGVSDSIILRAIVSSVIQLPSLSSLGIQVVSLSQDSIQVQQQLPPHRHAQLTHALWLSRTLNDRSQTEYVERILWYMDQASAPRSLQHHCRVNIRASMGPRRIRLAWKLPLPVSLKEYLLLDVDELK